MKTEIYNLKGEKKGNIELPKFFSERIREDIVQKYFEADKLIQPYSVDKKAGKKNSASGTISHKRHDWKGHYGRGISRIPRKTMWRRGTQFMWVGAEVSSVRGGRRAHPPKGIGKEKKINKKEIKIAMNSGFASTGNNDFIVRRYSSLDKLEVKVPVVVESGLEGMKTKDFFELVKKIFGKKGIKIALKKKVVRGGKGKLRGRKYKSNAGLLVVVGENEKFKTNGVEIKMVGDISIKDLYPLGRLTIYTEKAMEELKK